MAHPSKQKGNRFERLIVDKAQSYGVAAERAWGSNGQSIGCHEEVDVLMGEDFKIQAKVRKKIASFLEPTEHVDAVFCKQDRGPILVIQTLDKWLEALDEQ